MIKSNSKYSILITNDDSVYSLGIRTLIDAVKHLGEVYVVAPDKPQSGMGHAITVNGPLTITDVPEMCEANVKVWKVSGTPADCVKIAIGKVLNGLPDICLSGINHGDNHSINVIYSGTMSAAMEASIEGIPSIGFSLMDYALDADMSTAKYYVTQIVSKLLGRKIEKHLCLNVNIPAVPQAEIAGIKFCRQAKGKYEEHFEEKEDASGKKSYWLSGGFVNLDAGTDTDVWALAHNYISIVPVKPDMTNHHLKGQLERLIKF